MSREELRPKARWLIEVAKSSGLNVKGLTEENMMRLLAEEGDIATWKVSKPWIGAVLGVLVLGGGGAALTHHLTENPVPTTIAAIAGTIGGGFLGFVIGAISAALELMGEIPS